LGDQGNFSFCKALILLRPEVHLLEEIKVNVKMGTGCFAAHDCDFAYLNKLGYFRLWQDYLLAFSGNVELLAPVTERDGKLLLDSKIEVLDNQSFLIKDTPADLLAH